MKLIVLFLFIIFHYTGLSQNSTDKKLSIDGPYVLHEDGQLKIIQVNEKGEVQIAREKLTESLKLHVMSNEENHSFGVPLHPIKIQPKKLQSREKTLVISDPHGDLESFLSVLQTNGVVNRNYEWTFGKNHLVIIGDVFDRGNDVLPIFWLIYKWEEEAENAGGLVTFVLGNHEEMVLRNNLKYTNKKYITLAEKLNVNYNQLWMKDSELGRWLSSKNLIQIIGDDLYVHAGLSTYFMNKFSDIDKINEEVRSTIFLSKEERTNYSKLSDSIYSNRGPLWYRGMVRSDEKYLPIDDNNVDKILKMYNVKRIIVGHTIFDDITHFFGGKIIGVNVNNKKNREKGQGRGILIEHNKTYIIYDTKEPQILY